MAKKSKEGSSYSYIKQLFIDHPELLKEKRNAAILARYRADHGLAEDAPIEKTVMNNLANIKSNMRKAVRTKAASKEASRSESERRGRPTKQAGALEQLEVMIDDTLSFAKSQATESLIPAINLLRMARNKVVWLQGEK
ncbi:MAG: hypothetical protein EXS16_04205 [Gemmataceae bacterium]|nr:hypothetical protein [Gemmataceae bacterium]